MKQNQIAGRGLRIEKSERCPDEGPALFQEAL